MSHGVSTVPRIRCLLLVMLLATLSSACFPWGSLDEDRERVKRENALLLQEPIFVPPPDATELVRYEHEASFVNTSSHVTVIYASPQSVKKVAAWYRDNDFDGRYDLSVSPPGLQGSVDVRGRLRGDRRLSVGVTIQPQIPEGWADNAGFKPVSPGTRSYILAWACYCN